MILYANGKINLGLDIVARRPDGYHDISSLMLPVTELCDLVELLPAAQSSLAVVGNTIDCPPEKNLCMRALKLMQEKFGVGQVEITLQKRIPAGAGLGGGSSDAAAVIKGINELFSLSLDIAQMEALAAELGSDVPFFIANRPAMVSGRGEILSPAPEKILGELAGKHLLVIKPDASVSTAYAYSGIRPDKPATPLSERLNGPLGGWRNTVTNAFENHIFTLYPHLGVLKWALYQTGAIYATMSGSGSALAGIYSKQPDISLLPGELFIHQQIIPGAQDYAKTGCSLGNNL